MRGQCKLGQKELSAPFYKAINYETAFLGKKRLGQKRYKVSSVSGRSKYNYYQKLLRES